MAVKVYYDDDADLSLLKGKTISIIVGYQAGDGYDIWSRLLAAHMGKHIPGNPGMIAQNMPGAGSMTRIRCWTRCRC